MIFILGCSVFRKRDCNLAGKENGVKSRKIVFVFEMAEAETEIWSEFSHPLFKKHPNPPAFYETQMRSS